MEDTKQRFLDLKKKSQENNSKKIRLEEQMRSAKKQLVEVMDEIKAAGIDPKEIGEVLRLKKVELSDKLAELERQVGENSSKLEEIEASL